MSTNMEVLDIESSQTEESRSEKTVITRKIVAGAAISLAFIGCSLLVVSSQFASPADSHASTVIKDRTLLKRVRFL